MKYLTLIISALLIFGYTVLCPVRIFAYNITGYPRSYQTEVIFAVNQVRVENKLNKVEIDPDLCALAEHVSSDSETVYPGAINTEWKTAPNYKEYLKNYDKFKSESFTLNDILANLAHKSSDNTGYSQEDLIRMLSSKDHITPDNTAYDPDITHACVGASDGVHGFKGFAYFIGGVKNVTVDEEPTHWYDSIVYFFNNLW